MAKHPTVPRSKFDYEHVASALKADRAGLDANGKPLKPVKADVTANQSKTSFKNFKAEIKVMC